MQGNSNRRLKLKNQLEDQKKAYLENNQRKEAYESKQTQLAEATTDTQRRAINFAIPQSEIDWINKNHDGLETPYRNWVDNVSSQLTKAANFMSMKYDMKIDMGHLISGAGAKDNPYELTGKLTPTTSYDSAGANDVGMSELHASNIRHGKQNVHQRTNLDQLGVNSNWHWSSTNFVSERPDIRDPEIRASMDPPLKPLSPKPSHLGLNLLAVGDIDVDDLQAKMWLEHEYKNAGIKLNPEQQADLGKFFKDQRNKELIINAEKHSWKRRSSDKLTPDGQVVWKRGDLVLDKNNQPVREDNWNLDTKKKYSPDNERFEQRDREFFAAEQRKNPIETTLPSQTATTPKAMFKELGKVGGKKLFREVVRKMGGSNNVIANISGDIIGTVMDGVSYAQTKDKQALTDLCLSGGQAMASLGALGIACLPIPGARPGAFALMKVGDNLASVERIYNLMGGTSTVDRLLNNHKGHKHNKNLLETPTTRTKVKV